MLKGGILREDIINLLDKVDTEDYLEKLEDLKIIH